MERRADLTTQRADSTEPKADSTEPNIGSPPRAKRFKKCEKVNCENDCQSCNLIARDAYLNSQISVNVITKGRPSLCS